MDIWEEIEILKEKALKAKRQSERELYIKMIELLLEKLK